MDTSFLKKLDELDNDIDYMENFATLDGVTPEGYKQILKLEKDRLALMGSFQESMRQLQESMAKLYEYGERLEKINLKKHVTGGTLRDKKRTRKTKRRNRYR